MIISDKEAVTRMISDQIKTFEGYYRSPLLAIELVIYLKQSEKEKEHLDIIFVTLTGKYLGKLLYTDISLTENYIKQLHRDLLQYGEKDSWHRIR